MISGIASYSNSKYNYDYNIIYTHFIKESNYMFRFPIRAAYNVLNVISLSVNSCYPYL